MSEHTIKSITPTRFIIKTTRTWQTPESSKSCSSSSGLNNNNRKTGSDWRIIAASSLNSELKISAPARTKSLAQNPQIQNERNQKRVEAQNQNPGENPRIKD